MSRISVLGLVFFSFHLAASTTYTWTGAVDNQLDLNANWSPEKPTFTPTDGDVGIFNNSPTNTAPFLNSGATFAMFDASFNSATTNSYTFQISNGSTLQFGISGQTSSSFISGVETSNNSDVLQSFTVDSSSTLDFFGVSTANNLSTGKVNYYIGTTTPGTLNFQDQSSAGFSIITAGDATGDSAMTFSNNSTAANAILNVGTSSSSPFRATLTFSNSSSAENSTITIGNTSGSNNSSGALIFLNNSTAANATINLGDHLGDSTIDFYSDSSSVFTTAGNAVITIKAAADSSKDTDGVLTFHGFSTAENAMITLGDTLGNAEIVFNDSSTAGSAVITIGDNNNNLKATGGFNNTSSAAQSQIFVNNGSSLTFSSGSSSENSSITLTNTSTLNLNSPGTYTLNSLISASGCTTNFSNANLSLNYNGLTPIEINGDLNGSGGIFTMAGSGIAALNGPVTGDVVITNGSVIGDGIITGNLTLSESGEISATEPSNIRNIQGNYTQDSSAIYSPLINIESSSLLNISGTATLNSSLLTAKLTSTGWSPNSPYPILSTIGGITGTFATPSVVFPENIISPWITASIFYDPNLTAFLVLETNFISGIETSNQKHVANQIDSIVNMTPCESSLISALAVLQTPNELQHALDELSGEPYANQYFLVENANRHFIQSIFEPLRPIINSHGMPCLKKKMVWILGGVGASSINSSTSATGLNATSYDISIGAYSGINDHVTLGGALFFEHDHINYKINAHGTNRTFLSSIYALYRPETYYILIDLIGGLGKNYITRSIAIGDYNKQAKGSPLTTQWTFYGESGIDWQVKHFLFQPFLGLETGFSRTNGFNETGAKCTNLTYFNNYNYSTASKLGLHLTTELKHYHILFGLDAAWNYSLPLHKNSINTSFTTFGQNFSIEGSSLSPSNFEGALFIHSKIKDCWKLFAKLSGQKWSHASSYNFIGGVETFW